MYPNWFGNAIHAQYIGIMIEDTEGAPCNGGVLHMKYGGGPRKHWGADEAG